MVRRITTTYSIYAIRFVYCCFRDWYKKTTQASSLISLYVTAIAAVVSGFFSEIVSITLCIDLMLGAIITATVRAYYKKNM